MTEVMLDLKQWGNNLGVRLPAAIAREAHLHVHQRVRISVSEGLITIAPVQDIPLTLEQRLAEIIRQTQRDQWLNENKGALEDYNRRIETRGVFGDGLRRF